MIEGIEVLALLADKGYDINSIIDYAREMGMEVCIPPKSNRKEQRDYDKKLYKYRHIVENTFLILKQWRGIATRYAKNTSSFLAAVRLRLLHNYLTVWDSSCPHSLTLCLTLQQLSNIYNHSTCKQSQIML